MGYNLKKSVKAYQVGKYGKVPKWVKKAVDEGIISIEEGVIKSRNLNIDVENVYLIQGNNIEFVPDGDYILKLDDYFYPVSSEMFERIIAQP